MSDPQPVTTEGESLYEKYMLHHPADIRGCLKQLVDKRCVLLVHAAMLAPVVDPTTQG